MLFRSSNIIGQLSFQLLLSGPSEELIFRAFAITMLGIVIKKRVINGKVSTANFIAAVIFGLAHMSFSFAPFAVVYSPFQVVMAIVLGLFYGDCYEKSKSMYYPMMMHSISNIVMVGLSVIATFMPQIRPDVLAKERKVGRMTIYRHLRKLIEAGYVTRKDIKVREPDGTFKQASQIGRAHV